MTKMQCDKHPSDIQNHTAVKTQVQCSADYSNTESLGIGSGVNQAIQQN